METQTAQIIATQVDKVMAHLDKLAVKLGLTVEQIWPWMVRQQYVDAIVSLVLLIVVSIGGYLTYRFASKIKQWEEPDAKNIFCFILITISFIGIIISIASFREFSDIFNAEYWALKDLMKMIK
jgi:predicted permease